MDAAPRSATMLSEAWKQYRDGVYPEGVSGIQERECHQAFFAGCLVMCGFLNQLSAMPDDQAEMILASLILEAETVGRARMIVLKDQN